LPQRQQTLRNTIQWSYDLLTPEEQRLFGCLSVFVGGCTVEAVEAVCAALGNETANLLDGVASLIDKSLLYQTGQEGEEPRLAMLETVREFGLDCLQRQGELEAAARGHARYYLALGEAAEPHLSDSQQLLWFDRLERDLDNLRAILRVAMSGGEEEVQLALRLASALRLFWLGRGYLREGRSVLEQLLANTRATVAPVRLKALNALGAILWVQSDARRLAQVADEALALARKQGDHLNLTVALILRGTAALHGTSKTLRGRLPV
jgi:predicted ATPase